LVLVDFVDDRAGHSQSYFCAYFLGEECWRDAENPLHKAQETLNVAGYHWIRGLVDEESGYRETANHGQMREKLGVAGQDPSFLAEDHEGRVHGHLVVGEA